MSRTITREGLLKRLNDQVSRSERKFGKDSASLGSHQYDHSVVPSPSLMLDYRLGIGGFPLRYAVEVYGLNSIGKSSCIVYPTIANAQKQDLLVALIAAEPVFDPNWVARFGVDTDLLFVQRPDNVEQAFEMLYDLVYGNLADYIVLDSLGGMGTESETEGGGKKAFGISGVVTSGMNSIMPRLWKNNQGLLIVNQQRQNTKVRSSIGGIDYESPGGEALHHNCVIRIQLKPGKDRFVQKIGKGQDIAEILLGRELVCTIKKNKLAMNTKAARFNFYYIPTEEHPLGVDTIDDVMRVGKITGVLIQNGSWLDHPSFPDGHVNGEAKFIKLAEEHPEVLTAIREDVLAKMQAEQIALRAQADEVLADTDEEVEDGTEGDE